LIAEDMIENVEGFIHQFKISQAFLGVTLMYVVKLNFKGE
jgi:Ca2+/H+ antiporter